MRINFHHKCRAQKLKKRISWLPLNQWKNSALKYHIFGIQKFWQAMFRWVKKLHNSELRQLLKTLSLSTSTSFLSKTCNFFQDIQNFAKFHTFLIISLWFFEEQQPFWLQKFQKTQILCKWKNIIKNGYFCKYLNQLNTKSA